MDSHKIMEAKLKMSNNYLQQLCILNYYSSNKKHAKLYSLSKI